MIEAGHTAGGALDHGVDIDVGATGCPRKSDPWIELLGLGKVQVQRWAEAWVKCFDSHGDQERVKVLERTTPSDPLIRSLIDVSDTYSKLMSKFAEGADAEALSRVMSSRKARFPRC